MRGLYPGPGLCGADIRELRECFLERTAVPLNFLNIGYIVLLKYCLSTYRCQKINGVMYMYMSPNDMCYTTKVRCGGGAANQCYVVRVREITRERTMKDLLCLCVRWYGNAKQGTRRNAYGYYLE